MLIGWDNVSELRTPTSLLFISKVWYVSMESHGGMILTGENRRTRVINPSQCHFVQHKSHMDLTGRETGPPRWEGRRLTAWAMVGPRYLRHEIEVHITMDCRKFSLTKKLLGWPWTRSSEVNTHGRQRSHVTSPSSHASRWSVHATEIKVELVVFYFIRLLDAWGLWGYSNRSAVSSFFCYVITQCGRKQGCATRSESIGQSMRSRILGNCSPTFFADMRTLKSEKGVCDRKGM
jgi:hypothetical protein